MNASRRRRCRCDRRGRRAAARLLRCSLGAALLAAAVVLVPAGAAMACSCVEAPSDQTLLAGSDAVFTGTLVERHEPTPFLGLSSGNDPAVLVFDVDTVHKGSVARKQGIETARSGASCGLELTRGREALVFADRVDGHLEGSLCGGSRELGAGEQPLGAGTEPHPGSAVELDDGLRPVVAGAAGLAGLGLLAALAAVVVRRRRRAGSVAQP
jgi:hypothetical protein